MNNSMQKQKGAALVIGLIVLLVMTLIGISSMSSTTTELKMANNLQTHNYAFQAAETIIDNVLAPIEPNPVIGNINWGVGGTQTFNNVYPAAINTISSGNGTIDADVQVIYVDCVNVPEGYDISGGDQEGGGASFKGLVHDINVSTTVLSTNGNSIGQAQSRLNGAQTVRPGCPGA